MWLEGRCLDIGMTVSYWPFLDLLRTHFGWMPEDDERARARRVEAALRAMAEAGNLPPDRVDEIGPVLGTLLSVQFGSDWDTKLVNAGPEQVKHQTFLAIRDLVLALAKRRPLVLVMEDLHWADSLSLDVLSLLMETLTLAPILLVCVYRPEQDHKCWHLATIAARKCPDRYAELRLRELTPQQSRRLIEALLHIEDLPSSVKDLIQEKAQGNPFFVEEVVRSLIDSGLVYRDDAAGAWRAREEIGTIAVPESVQSIILSRVDRLEQDVRQVLQSAAVIGRLFRKRLLSHVTQQSDVLDRALWELEERQLIYEERPIPEEEYSFQHVLTQDTVYRNILRRRRATFHRHVAEAIEKLYADSLDDYYEQLAHHYDQAGVVAKATEYALKAGQKAQRSFLNEQAVAFFQRALEQLAEHPEAGDAAWRLEAAIELNECLGDVLGLLARRDEARAALQAALDCLPAEAAIARARLLHKIGNMWSTQRKFPEALAAFDAAAAALGEPHASAPPEWWQEWFDLHTYRGFVYYWVNDAPQIAALLDKLRPTLDGHARPEHRALFWALHLNLQHRLDRYAPNDVALEYVQKMLAALRELGEASEQIIARSGTGFSPAFMAGFSCLWCGRLAEAEMHLLTALAATDRTGDLTARSRCLAYLAVVHRKRGDLAGTQRYAEQALEVATTSQMLEYIASAKGHLAWAAVRQRQYGEAKALALDGYEKLQQVPIGAVFIWMVAWPLLAVAVAEGRLADAAAYARHVLLPTEQPLPADVDAALRAAVAAWEARPAAEAGGAGGAGEARSAFERAVEVARETGYA